MAKPNFSKLMIYTGGIRIAEWKYLNKVEQQNALKKDWYVYYSFRNGATGKLVRQNPIKHHANLYKSFKERLAYLNVLRDSLELLLKNGANPNLENDFTYLDEILGNSIQNQNNSKVVKEVKQEVVKIDVLISIKDAFELVLKLKQNVMNETSFGNYQLRIKKLMN